MFIYIKTKERQWQVEVCNSTIVLQNKSSLHNWLLQPLTCQHASRREKCEFLQIISPEINCFNLKVRLSYLLASSDILSIIVKSLVSINMPKNWKFSFVKFYLCFTLKYICLVSSLNLLLLYFSLISNMKF